MQLLSEELGVVGVEGERRPQPDGCVAAAPAVHALLAQVSQDGVAPVREQDFKLIFAGISQHAPEIWCRVHISVVSGHAKKSSHIIPCTGIGVNGAICPDAPGRVHETREIVLRLLQSLEEDVSGLAGLLEEVILFDCLQNGLQKHDLA